jgi:hypothetical protein
LNRLEHLVGKGNVLSAIVGPSGVQPIRSNEDGSAGRQGEKAVILATDNGTHVTVEPMVAKNELVGGVWVIVARQLQSVLAILAVDRHALDAARYGRLATSCRSSVGERQDGDCKEREQYGEFGPHGDEDVGADQGLFGLTRTPRLKGYQLVYVLRQPLSCVVSICRT